MKRFFSALLVITLLLGVSSAIADGIDLSQLSIDELVALKDKINLAIWNSQEWQEVKVPQGVWKVGEDIPAGHWSIEACPGGWANIYNGMILIACLVGLAIDAVYYLAFAGEFFFPFLMDCILTAALSIFFYSQGIWGAGDSKLLILIALCLPGRIFCRDGLWSFPGFLLITIIFAVSFLVVFIDSIISFREIDQAFREIQTKS